MNSEPLALSGLEDIVLTPKPPLWPPAPGAWLLAAFLVCLALIALNYWCSRRRAGQYRRAGLVLLAAATSLREIDVILKRVGLAAFPRESVAPLYGAEWAGFLDTTCSRCNFSSLLSSHESPSLESYRACARNWIRFHKKPR